MSSAIESAALQARGSIAQSIETVYRALTLFGVLIFAMLPVSANASETRTFRPEGCEYRTSIERDAAIKSGWRGENLFTTATVKGADRVVRASCGAYYVRDWRAFRKALPEQLERAARVAGVAQPQTAIRRTSMGTVASFWGFRGQGANRTFYRSDSYVGNRSYLEIVVMTPPQNRYSDVVRKTRLSVNR